MIAVIRSTVFNLCFYILTAFACIALLPTLLLPRRYFMGVVHGFVHTTAFLERYILNLRFEIRGQENLPEKGPYIIAAKHQSAYETFKLHILFDDPAVVLKRELLKIPFWGKYLGKSDPIAINRSSPKEAIKSLKQESKRVAAQERALIIFPQGTRTSITTSPIEKPYKIGIVRMQEATELPIIPMALNTGYFYPKHKWIKKSGTVVFEFLKPIPYEEDKEASSTLNQIEMRIEEKSSHLLAEAKEKQKRIKASHLSVIFLALIFAGYSTHWFIAAHYTEKAINTFLSDFKNMPVIDKHTIGTAKLTGYPFKLQLLLENQSLSSSHDALHIERIHAQTWPFLGMPIDINIKNISMSHMRWTSAVNIDEVNATLVHKDNTFDIKNSVTKSGETQLDLSGTINQNTTPYPTINISLALSNAQDMLSKLAQSQAIPSKQALIAAATLAAMEKDGIVTTTLTNQEHKVYLGLIKIFELPPVRGQ